MSHFSRLPNDATLLDIFDADPRFDGIMHTIGTWMRGPSELTVAEREMLAAYVAVLNECAYCIAAHKSLATAYGLDPAIMNAVLDDDCARTCSRTRAILDLTRKITLAPSTMNRTDVENVLDAGLSEGAAQEVLVIAALFGMITRLAEAHGVKAGRRQLQTILERLGPDVRGSVEAA